MYLPECALKSPPPPVVFTCFGGSCCTMCFFLFFVLVDDVPPPQTLSRRILKNGREDLRFVSREDAGCVRSMPICYSQTSGAERHSNVSWGRDECGQQSFTPRKLDGVLPCLSTWGIFVTCTTNNPPFFVALLMRLRYGAQVEEEPYSLKLWTLMRMRPALDEQNHREGNRR